MNKSIKQLRDKVNRVLNEYAEPTPDDGSDVAGFQIGDEEGWVTQGDPEDTSGLASFEVIRPDAVATFHALYPGYHLVPVGWDDVEDPVFLDSHMLTVTLRKNR